MDADAPVLVSRGPPASREWDEVVCVVPTASYDVGLRTRASVRRQLAADVPRSVVRVRGERVASVDAVLRGAGVDLARLCTQAVLAPPVEWLLAHDLVAHELRDGGPMEVDVDASTVRVAKRLGLREWDDLERSRGALRLTVLADARWVVVTMARLG